MSGGSPGCYVIGESSHRGAPDPIIDIASSVHNERDPVSCVLRELVARAVFLGLRIKEVLKLVSMIVVFEFQFLAKTP